MKLPTVRVIKEYQPVTMYTRKGNEYDYVPLETVDIDLNKVLSVLNRKLETFYFKHGRQPTFVFVSSVVLRALRHGKANGDITFLHDNIKDSPVLKMYAVLCL